MEQISTKDYVGTDYGLIHQKDNIIYPNINAFYGPWHTIASAEEEILKVLPNKNDWPIGLTIGFYDDKDVISEYWWVGADHGTNGWTQKTSGRGSNSGTITPVTNLLQVWTTNGNFIISTDVDGKCSQEALKTATTSTVLVVYNGEQIKSDPGDDLVLETSNDADYDVMKSFDSASCTFKIWLQFKNQDCIVKSKNVFISYKYLGQIGEFPLLVSRSESNLTYVLSHTPESFYIPETGILPEVVIDVDAYDPYNNETYNLKANDLILSITYDHIENGNSKHDQIGNDIFYDGDKWTFGPDSNISINGNTCTLQSLYNNNNEQYLKTGERFTLTLKDKQGIKVEEEEIRIVRSTAIAGPGVKTYDVSLTDEYITFPSAWLGSESDNIKARTKTFIKIQMEGEELTGKIIGIDCQNSDYIEGIEIIDGNEQITQLDYGNHDIVGYRFTQLNSDDVVSVKVQFTDKNGELHTETVNQILSNIDTVTGETYSLLCSDLALGVDKNDDKELSQYELTFKINKNLNGQVEEVKFTDAKIYSSDATDIGNNTCIQLQHIIKDSSIENTGINNIQGQLLDDNKTLRMTFSVEEAKFNSMSLKFCLWMNGAVYDYGNVGMYILPKDGANYNLYTSISSIPVNQKGVLPEDLIVDIRMEKAEYGKVSLLTGKSEFVLDKDNNYTYKESEDAEYYIGFRAFGKTGCDIRFKDYGNKTENVNSLTYDEDKSTYSLNLRKQFYNFLGVDSNVTVTDNIAKLNWEGFTLVVKRITKNGEIEYTKDFLCVLPGQNGENGKDGKDGKEGKAGAQLRYLGEWSDTKGYCYLSAITNKEQYKLVNGKTYEWVYGDDENSQPEYSNDDIRYIDVVCVTSNSSTKYYQALQNSRNQMPTALNSEYWGEAQHFGMLITDAMIAKVIDSKSITTDEILIKSSDSTESQVKYIGGFTNIKTNTIPEKEDNLVIWSGASKNSGEDAKFKVYADGTLKCTGLDSSINGLITSTNEVEVPLSKLEPKEIYVDQDHQNIKYLVLDFTKFGSNINIIDDLNDGVNSGRILIDLPAYAFTGDTREPHGGVSEAFNNRGYTSNNEIKQYIKFVNKYKTTNIRIRTNGIKNLGGLSFRGCLSVNITSNAPYPWNQDLISRSLILKSSLGYPTDAIATNYHPTNSINSVIDFETTQSNNMTYLPLFVNLEKCYLGWPLQDYSINDSSICAFDVSFSPRTFTIIDEKQLGRTFNDTQSYLDNKYNGIYWESTSLYTLSNKEAEYINS